MERRLTSASERAVGITASQTLFNGNRTANRTRAAESQVSSAREGLRVLEQSVLLSAASVASLMLTTECMVAEAPKDEGAAPAMPGGMGGMGMDM